MKRPNCDAAQGFPYSHCRTECENISRRARRSNVRVSTTKQFFEHLQYVSETRQLGNKRLQVRKCAENSRFSGTSLYAVGLVSCVQILLTHRRRATGPSNFYVDALD